MVHHNDPTEFIPIELSNGTIIKFEMTQTGREDAVSKTLSFKQVTDVLEGIIESIPGYFAQTVEKFGKNSDSQLLDNRSVSFNN